jgi:hypothetical protein
MKFLPNRNFRKTGSYNQTKCLFRVYRRSLTRKKGKFALWGSFENLEGAKKFAIREQMNYEYVIKQVEVTYNEMTVDQSLVRMMNERLPELDGVI